jgi:hypothetical protein
MHAKTGEPPVLRYLIAHLSLNCQFQAGKGLRARLAGLAELKKI